MLALLSAGRAVGLTVSTLTVGVDWLCVLGLNSAAGSRVSEHAVPSMLITSRKTKTLKTLPFCMVHLRFFAIVSISKFIVFTPCGRRKLAGECLIKL